MYDLAQLGFGVLGGLLGVLVAANAVLIAARLSHHDKLARSIVKRAARVTWLFKLGDDGGGRSMKNGHSRA